MKQCVLIQNVGFKQILLCGSGTSSDVGENKKELQS